MDFDKYQEAAMRTAKELPLEKALHHAVMGVAGEAGELSDAVKKHTIYGKEFDLENYYEEIGDVLWFASYAASIMGKSLNEIAEHNIAKLAKRYPDAYSDLHAIARLDKNEES